MFLSKRIDDFDLSSRTSSVLRTHEIDFIYELISFSESDLLRYPNFGENSLKEICLFLKSNFNLSLSTDVYSDKFIKKYCNPNYNIDEKEDSTKNEIPKDIIDLYNNEQLSFLVSG